MSARLAGQDHCAAPLGTLGLARPNPCDLVIRERHDPRQGAVGNGPRPRAGVRV